MDKLIKQTCEWLKATGPESQIVLSSRVRLARNLNRYPFSHWAGKRHERDVLSQSQEAIKGCSLMKRSLWVSMSGLSDLDKQLLVERHLISKEHLMDPEYKAVAISEKEIISIMINEEDHIRVQVMQSGLNLQEAWKIANSVDDELSKKLNFAFDSRLGFLTACPTNAGTGLRASVMLHLPALVMTKQINRVVQAISKLGMVVRGLYGEGTDADGNLFQVSNQITLGQSEEETIDHIERIITQLIGHEQSARKQLFKQNKELLKDKIWRAYGTLRNAFIITSIETIRLLSTVRMGIDLGIIKDINAKAVNELFILTQPAHMQRVQGKLLAQSDRDIMRAQIIRKRLANSTINGV